LAALAAAAVAAFYASMWLLPKFTSETADDDGAGLFRAALGIALGLGFTAALVGLTLPWKRRRRRGGRGRRLAISAVVVIIASVTFAAQEHHLVYDLLFATWLAYALAYTYVRYGLLDKPRTRSSGGSVAAASVE
jgi:peptidoglycan/LPS O-acetylase OafA/YrhL